LPLDLYSGAAQDNLAICRGNLPRVDEHCRVSNQDPGDRGYKDAVAETLRENIRSEGLDKGEELFIAGRLGEREPDLFLHEDLAFVEGSFVHGLQGYSDRSLPTHN
jgi:hypothetical protein